VPNLKVTCEKPVKTKWPAGAAYACRVGDVRWWIRLLRYSVGSGVAALGSAVTFALAYRVLGEGPLVASVAAFLVGAVVNFVAGRFWAWGRRSRPGLGRDALSFGVVAVLSALAATGVTTVTHGMLHDADPNRRAVLVEASYFATYAVLFGLKFLVLDRVVFRSRHHVPTTTHA
jgi:putative flippase GtrA